MKALIITGEGPKYFAAGADIKEMADQTYDEVRLPSIPAFTFTAICFFHEGQGATLQQLCTAEIKYPKALMGTELLKPPACM